MTVIVGVTLQILELFRLTAVTKRGSLNVLRTCTYLSHISPKSSPFMVSKLRIQLACIISLSLRSHDARNARTYSFRISSGTNRIRIYYKICFFSKDWANHLWNFRKTQKKMQICARLRRQFPMHISSKSNSCPARGQLTSHLKSWINSSDHLFVAVYSSNHQLMPSHVWLLATFPVSPLK